VSSLDLPSDWSTVSLGELLSKPSDLTYGVVQPGAADPDGVPIVRVRDIREGRVVVAEPLRISPNVEANYRRSRIQGGELLVSLVGTVGEVAIAPDSLRGWNTARAVATVRLPSVEDSKWVGYCLRSPAGRSRIESRVNTTVQTTLNLKDLRDFPIPMPPLSERTAIAGVLGALDDKIESNRRIARITQELARAELQDAVRSGSEIICIADLLESVHERVSTLNSKLSYVGLEHFTGFDLALWRFGVSTDSKTATKLARPGDLLFGRIRPYFGNVAVIGRSAVVAQSVEVLRAKDNEYAEVAYLCASSIDFIESAVALSSGTTMPQVKWSDLKSRKVEVPLVHNVKRFHLATAPLFDLLERLPAESEQLGLLRDSLLPELLSGRMRLNDIEKVVEGAL